MPSLFKCLGICLDISNILSLDSLFQACKGSIDSIPLVSRNLVAIVFKILLGLEAKRISTIDLIDSLLLSLVGSLIGLSLITHSLDFILAKS